MLMLAVFGASSGRAFAHADLESTEPLAGSVVEKTPSQLVFRFTGAVDSVPGGIRVVAATGAEIDIGPPERLDGSSATLAVALPPLDNGTYVVAWRAVSADSHPIAGAFTFSVGSSSDPAPGLIDTLLDSERQLSGASTLLAGGRWASYSGMAVAIGVAGCALLLGSGLSSKRRCRLVLIGIATSAIGTVLMLAAQAAITVNRWSGIREPDAWRAVLETSAGRWWAIRIIAVVMVGGVGLALPYITRRRTVAVVAWSLAVMATFAVVAAGGHAISGRAIPVGFVATVVHLGAMTIWIGGLATIAFTATGERLALAHRFSPWAFGAVVALAATGVLNAWRQVGTFNGLTETEYGRWLLIKAVPIVVVAAIAGATRWMLVKPKPAARAAAVDGHVAEAADGAVPLRRLVGAELGCIVLVLLATAFLVNSPPARAVMVGPTSVSVVNGERIAQVTVDPARTGGTTMHVYITSTSSLDEPDEIVVQISLPDRGIGPLVIDTSRAGPSHVTTPSADFPLAGTWTVEVRARYGEFDLVTFAGQLVIR